MTLYQDALLYLAGARIMFSRLFRKPKEQIEWQMVRFLCLGLDGAGKTCMLRIAADPSMTCELPVEPTNGFKVRTIEVEPDCKAEVWDIGGSATLRPYWSRYATPGTDGLIWVVDGSAEGRLRESSEALRELLVQAAVLRSMPLLIAVSKSDQPAALSESAVSQGLHLEDLHREHLSVGPRRVSLVSASDGNCISEAFQWLVGVTLGRIKEPAMQVRSI